MIEVLGLYALLGLSFTIGKMLLAFVPPLFLIGIRMILAGCIILCAQYCMQGTLKIYRQDLGLFLLVALVHIFIPYSTEFIALQSIAPSCAALIFNLTPCFTAIFSYLVFKESMTLKKWVGFVVAMFGVWQIVPSLEMRLCDQGADYSYLLLLIAVISGSLGWVLVRKLLYKGYEPLHINGFAMFCAGVAAFVAAMVFEPTAALPWDHIGQFTILLLGIIVISNVLFYNIYSYLLKRYSATLLSFVGFLTPLFTSLYDWLWLDITVEPQFYIATVIVAYGIYIFYQEELRQGYVHLKN